MDGELPERALLERMLRLRPFRVEDEEASRAAHDAMQSDAFPFLLDYVPNEPWTMYLKRREANRRGEATAAALGPIDVPRGNGRTEPGRPHIDQT